MSTKIKIVSLISGILFIQLINVVYTQSIYELGILPTLNLNNKLKNDWSLNTKLESRQTFRNGDSDGNVNRKYNYVLTDLSLITAKKVGLNSRIAGGYLIRLEEGELFHRFIQQYIIVNRLAGFRLAHRFLSDQTFSEIEKPEFRLRYRITTEIPLNGESVDSKEFYLKINNEYLNGFQGLEYDLGIRLIPLLGYSMANGMKIETGLDYRVESFLNNNAEHSFWIALNFFIEK